MASPLSSTLSRAHVSGRRLTPASTADITLDSTFASLTPVWSAGRYGVSGDEDEFADVLTGVSDADDIRTEEELECVDIGVRETVRWGDLYALGTMSEEKKREEHGEQMVYASVSSLASSSFFGGEVSVECVFDAEVPLASNEELWLRSVFDPVAAPVAVGTLVDDDEEEEEEVVVAQEVGLLDTSDLKLLPTVAVHDFRDPVATWADFEAVAAGYPVGDEDIEDEILSRRAGRSLVPAMPVLLETEPQSVSEPEPVIDAEEQEKKKDLLDLLITDSTWKLEHDPVLRHITAHAFLPGLDNFAEVAICSALTQYDNTDIDALYHATTSFIDDHYDGECTCLDGKPATLRLPGENYLLADNEDAFGLSVARSRAQDIFELLDAVVDADMTEFVDNDESDDDEDMLGGGFLDDEQDLPRASVFFDAAAGAMMAFVALDQLLYPTTSIAEYPFIAIADSQTSDYDLSDDEQDVSDMSDSDADDVSTIQPSEWTYFDTDTHQHMAYTALEQLLQTDQHSELTYFNADNQQYVEYTAFNQLLQIDLDQMPQIVLWDIDDDYLELDEEATELLHCEFDETDLASLHTLTGPSRNAPVKRRLGGYGQFRPYMMYSSHQRPTVRSRRNVQLIFQPRRLYSIEEEGEDCLSPPSSADSLGFTMHCGVVKALVTRRENFLDDECDDEDGSEASMSSPASHAMETPTGRQYEEIFADAIWNVSPDLALTNPSHTLSTTPVLLSSLQDFPSLSVLESFGIEIHNHIALIFDCMNNERSHELPALSNDLNWALNALASGYPSMTLLGTLGVAVEILVERMVASSVVA